MAALTRAEYERTTLVELQKRRWRTTRPLTNGWGTIPAGVEVQITGKRGGLNLSVEPCGSCGLRAHVSKVFPNDVEEIFS